MKILGFDTSTSTCSVALKTSEGILLREESVPKQHVQKILGFIDELLLQVDLKLADLNAIAFGCGPGSFTGLRIASSIAQGLSFGVNKPVLPVSSLKIAAQTAHRITGATHVLVAQDARMNEVYWGQYQLDGQYMAAVADDALCAPKACSADREIDWLGVGDAWQSYAADFELKPNKIEATVLPSAYDLVEIATEMLRLGEGVPARQAKPNYLRNNVVCHK